MIRRAGAMVSATLAVGVLSLAIALPAAATPPGDASPPSGDDRATSHADNAKTCADAGLPGVVILKDDDPGNQQYLTIDPAQIPDGFELTGIVVKGGDGFNVYPPQHLTELHAPLVGQKDNVPEISHWFACGIEKEQSSTTSSPPPDNPDPSSPGRDGGSTTTTTTTPAPQGGLGGSDTAGTGGELANTGVSAVTPLVAGGGALVLLGAALLLLLRRTRHR